MHDHRETFSEKRHKDLPDHQGEGRRCRLATTVVDQLHKAEVVVRQSSTTMYYHMMI